MSKILTIIFGSSYKTSLLGYLGAIVLALEPIIRTGNFEWNDLILPTIIAVTSRAAKDSGKTGV